MRITEPIFLSYRTLISAANDFPCPNRLHSKRILPERGNRDFGLDRGVQPTWRNRPVAAPRSKLTHGERYCTGT
jgi:hypothetical protein